MTFDPMKPAAEMTALELMAAHIAMVPGAPAKQIVQQANSIYDELNRQAPDESETPE